MISSLRTPILFLIFFLLPGAASAATLNLSPSNETANVGSTFTEVVQVSSTDQALNAVSGTLTFPADLLQVVSVSKASSILTLWMQDPTFLNTDGTVSFSGIVPNPGYTGSHGRIISIQFRAKKEGTASITFTSSSQVLANDGNGTDILTGENGAAVTITAAVSSPVTPVTPTAPSAPNTNLLANITSSTHPDQTQWYMLSHALFDWTNTQGISAVQLGYDQNAGGTPSVVYSNPISHKELNLADGIWYFHVQEKDTNGWGPVSTYKVQIDTVPPLSFGITFPSGTTTALFGSTLPIQFTATDELSGIDHYQLAIDGKDSTVSAEEGGRPYAISGDTGTHIIAVRAYDKAGNMTSAEGKFTVVGGAPSLSPILIIGWLAINYFSIILVAVAVLCTLLFAAWYIHVHFSAYRRRLTHKLGLTHTHIHKEFENLKDAITEELLSLEQAKSERTLTVGEERLIIRFKKLLDQSERAIEKDVDEISR
jgi:hypothetical protein